MGQKELFDKKAFAILLDKARGDRSINQYANETDVSAAHISRFLRQRVDSPPTPETISKFAQKAANGVSYRDLMVAAGYLTEDSNEIEEDSPRNRKLQFDEMEKKFFLAILADLYTKDFEWSIQKPERNKSFPHMIIHIDHEGYKKWYLEFKGNINNNRPLGSVIPNIYGQIAMMKFMPTDKFTIAVNDEEVYEHLLKNPPASLRVNLYAMHVDLKAGKVVKEEKLCGYE